MTPTLVPRYSANGPPGVPPRQLQNEGKMSTITVLSLRSSAVSRKSVQWSATKILETDGPIENAAVLQTCRCDSRGTPGLIGFS